MRILATLVFSVVLHATLPASIQNSILPTLHGIVLLSNGHATEPIIPPTPVGANAVSISLTASALSFLAIASAIPLAICVSLLSAFIFFIPAFSASFSIAVFSSLLTV